MSNSRHMRQRDLVSESILDTPITVVGAGAIGSFTVLALAKCGFTDITVYDYDKIEEHNISNQFYPLNTVGMYKVDALHNMVHMFEGIDIKTINGAYNPDEHTLKGIVISAVDNMATREVLFIKVRRNPDVIAYIDGRMGGQQIEVYTCKVGDTEAKTMYKKQLWSDEEAENTRCTEKAVIYNVLIIAGMIVNQTRLVLEDKPYNHMLMMHLDTMDMVKIGGM